MCVLCLYSHIAVIFYPKLYVTIFLYHIYLSYVFLFLDIVFTYLSIFFICQYGYFAIHIFFAKCFSMFCLPDVVSPVFVLFTVMSLVVSICVILVDDDEPNKVKFVLIHRCDKWCETLHWYYITKNTLHCFWNHIYLSYVFISIHIYLCVAGVYFERVIEFDISYMLWEVHCHYPHLYVN